MDVLAILVVSCLWLGVSSNTCPAIYQRLSAQHTFCRTSTCQIVKKGGLTADVKQEIVRKHNELRSRVATGQENTNSLPQASNMLQMVWDDELASVAQKHADLCVFDHDCNECRGTKNFYSVGQNLASYPGQRPKPVWAEMVQSWYNEVADFPPEQIDDFRDVPPPTKIGHFTQIIWATTWRVGCGYTLYKAGGGYKELYTCNYGPGGNMKNGKIYEKGSPCSSCPINSCCGNSCSGESYPGLCKISGDNAPQYNPPAGLVFHCGFHNEADCATTQTGARKWKSERTLSGNFIGIVLNGGESSTLHFTTPFKPTQSKMCTRIQYRTGPNVAGDESAGEAAEVLEIPEIPNFHPRYKMRPQFAALNGGVAWEQETKISIDFSVPAGKPAQYLEVTDIAVTPGPC